MEFVVIYTSQAMSTNISHKFLVIIKYRSL